jgi:hypothetical protein
VLPYADNGPSRFCEQRIVAAIARDIAIDLMTPIKTVSLGNMTVLRAAVPEATIDEHGDTGRDKQDICLAPKPRYRALMFPEAQASSVEYRAEQLLRRGITAAVTPHDSRYGFRRRPRWQGRVSLQHAHRRWLREGRPRARRVALTVSVGVPKLTCS